MLQFTLAVRRCVARGRISGVAMRWYSTPAPDLSEGEREIHQKLTDRFSPSALRVQDISGTLSRSGFYNVDLIKIVGGCGTFYAIAITSEAFRGLSMVKQHQLVNNTLKSEIETIHGLQVSRLISHNPLVDFLYLASDDRT